MSAVKSMLHGIECVKAEKEALKKVLPSDLFRRETDKYSKFDEKVKEMFTHADQMFSVSV